MLAEDMVTEFFEHVNDELEFAKATAFKKLLDFGKKKLAHKEPISSQGWYHVRSQAFSHNSLSNCPNREEQAKETFATNLWTSLLLPCARLSVVAIVLMPWSTSDMNAKNI